MDNCERFREMVWAQTDELTAEEAAELAAHLPACADCSAEAEGVAAVRSSLAPVEEEAPGLEVLDRVRSRLALAAPAPTADVLTPEELAQMLRVSVDDIYDNLDALPAFEFAGRVRFRRRAIEAWMEEQEQRWRHEALTASVRSR